MLVSGRVSEAFVSRYIENQIGLMVFLAENLPPGERLEPKTSPEKEKHRPQPSIFGFPGCIFLENTQKLMDGFWVGGFLSMMSHRVRAWLGCNSL